MQPDDKLLQAIRAYEERRYEITESISKEIIRADPGNFRAFNLLGMSLHERGSSEQGAAELAKAIEINPGYLPAYNNLAALHKETGNFDRALSVVEKAMGVVLNAPELFLLKGSILLEAGRAQDAIEALQAALALGPRSPEALTLMGDALRELGRYPEALACHNDALKIEPRLAQAWFNMGKTLNGMKRFPEALAACDRAIAIQPDLAAAHVGRGHLLHDMERYPEALAAFDAALKLKPNFAEAWAGRANAFRHLERRSESFAAFERALALDPKLEFLHGDYLYEKMRLCDWRDFDRDCSAVIEGVRRFEPVAPPFMFLSLPASAADQLQCATIFAATSIRGAETPLPFLKKPDPAGRIRLCYVSSDFRDHAVTHLVTGVLERHDRKRFEVIAISLGKNDGSAARARVEKAVDRFIDVHEKSDVETVEAMRRLGIDIAVDLTGYTRGARTNVFAARPAPIQVNYLGYAGTMGADFIDYIVADETVIPPDDRKYFSEKVVYLPDSYFASDGSIAVPETKATRAEMGLPEKAFVFCSFINSYKITPDVFSVWMRLLQKAESSVLWLQGGEPADNLRREAAARGVPPDRLMFAPLMPFADYLAQHRLADLFLDTFHFNAHTTASHALWTGLPVLTTPGSTMASRGGASILGALGLPELIANSREDYEAIALRFATDPGYHASIRAKLAENRTAFPLFDTPRYTRHLEAAYAAMWKRYQNDEKPESFRVG